MSVFPANQYKRQCGEPVRFRNVIMAIAIAYVQTFRQACLLLVLILVVPTFGRTDPGEPDTLIIGTINITAPDAAVIPVSFFNDEPLTHIELTFIPGIGPVTIDSFSFIGSRLQDYAVKDAVLYGDAMSIFVIPFQSEPDIPPGTGLLGKIYLSYSEFDAPLFAFLDTITVVVNSIEHSTTFNSTDLNPFVPQFIPGSANIDGRCCVGIRGNVNGSVDNLVDILDLVRLISFLYIEIGQGVSCLHEANVNGSADGVIDITDLVLLINFLFIDFGLSPVADCP